MKHLFSTLLLCLFSLTICAHESTHMPYKLYPTDNTWIHIKLDTRNGRTWMVQYSVGEGSSRLTKEINDWPLVDKDEEINGRFELYETKNMYNFILLDRITGETWQVQWSTNDNEMRLRINCDVDKKVQSKAFNEGLPEMINIDGFDAVDLGLPSGTLWAFYNAGSKHPENYGNLFAWGETKPKEEYTQTNYIYYDTISSKYTKYCKDTTIGLLDNKIILEPIDDAATVNWSDRWKTPSERDMAELINQCKWEWGTLNDEPGYKVTGPNYNWIFIPSNYSSYFNESIGCYWTSSLSYNGESPRELYFIKDEVTIKNIYRYEGFCIRAVSKPTKK